MLNSDLKVYLPAEVSDNSTNGGRMTATAVTSGVVQNVWPHVPKAERLAGSTKYRKLFCKVADDDDGTLINPQYWLDDETAGDDWITFFVGTATDTQTDIVGTERKYGVAKVSTDVTASGTTIVCTVEDTALATGNDAIFQDGDTIRLTDMTDPSDSGNNEEFLTISGTPTVSVDEITITTAETISNAYTVASNSRVMSVYEPSDVECGTGTIVVTTAGDGDVDDTTYPPVLDNIGTIDQTITITFSDATNFTAASNVAGVTLSSGTKGTQWSPQNSDFSKPYITLDANFFTGTWANADTCVIPTTAAAVALWEKRVVPAAASSQANNKITLVTAGEAV